MTLPEALARIQELEEENGRLRDQLSMVELRKWTLGAAFTEKQTAADSAKLNRAAELEAYLLGSHSEKVNNLVNPLLVEVVRGE